MASWSSTIGSTTLITAKLVPIKPVARAVSARAVMAGTRSPAVPEKSPVRWAMSTSKMPTSGTPEVISQVEIRRYLMGGSRVASSKRRATAWAATGRTRRSACR